LLRDYSNPVDDKQFPVLRSFDFYHGHSWAKGLYGSGDGKDQESSSEDVFASFAIMMWGRTVGSPALEARGALMLATQKRSNNLYYLLSKDDGTHPAGFSRNYVSCILFENKIDSQGTYFGNLPEYIHGIHMVPVSAASVLIRQPSFVRAEWNALFNRPPGRSINSVDGGWKSILMTNLALSDAGTAYRYFSASNWSDAALDGGTSQSWCLLMAAALGGA